MLFCAIYLIHFFAILMLFMYSLSCHAVCYFVLFIYFIYLLFLGYLFIPNCYVICYFVQVERTKLQSQKAEVEKLMSSMGLRNSLSTIERAIRTKTGKQFTSYNMADDISEQVSN